uniref:Uncharacterized protein n=1 Tax=Arundo donax TaxID=35708 RepID=A0A0A9DZ88_ARUDO
MVSFCSLHVIYLSQTRFVISSFVLQFFLILFHRTQHQTFYLS